jgi:hypothetical protein
MAHGKKKRTKSMSPTRVFTMYATLLQSMKDHRVRKRFAALCHSDILQVSLSRFLSGMLRL